MAKFSNIVIILLLVVIALLVWLAFVKPAQAPVIPAPVATTTPTQTENPDTTPIETGTKPLHEKIVVTSPKSNANVQKTFTVTGKAPGNWFFEASAPYVVTTPEGDKIAQGTIQAVGEWMTTDLVDFKASVSTNPAYSGPATLVLMKDNPSGMPEHDDSLEIPIVVQ